MSILLRGLGSCYKWLKNAVKPPNKDAYLAYHHRKSINMFLVYALPLIVFRVIEDYTFSSNIASTGCASVFHFLGIIIGILTHQYKILDTFLFSIYLCQPINMQFNGPELFAAPAQVIFASMCIFAFTRRPYFAIIHLVCQVTVFWIFVLPAMQAYVLKFTPEEFAAIVPAICLTTLKNGTLRFSFILCYFYFNQNMLKKLDRLREKLSNMNEQLTVKHVQLEEALEERRMFILTFSHEFKNALNGLLGALKVAIDQVTDKETKDLLDTANTCAYILRNFTHNILDSGKIENHQLEVAAESTNTVGFLTNLWRLSAEMIKSKRLKGFMRINKNVPRMLMLDTQKIFQVLMNVTSNSIKFTKTGHINYVVEWEPIERGQERISLSHLAAERSHTMNEIPSKKCEILYDIDEGLSTDPISFPQSIGEAKRNLEKSYLLDFQKRILSETELKSFSNHSSSNKGYLKISIIDTGCGMSKESSKLLFKKFSQVSDEAHDRKKGSGLGLWITKQLVELMGGDIIVKTKKDVGSTFEMRFLTEISQQSDELSLLPTNAIISLNGKSVEDEFAQNMNLSLGPGPRLFQRDRKILIADDDSFNVTLLSSYLKKLGMNVLVAQDGQELLDEFMANYQDVLMVITDNNMPRMQGKDAIVEINSFLEKKGMKKLPIYLVTGDDERNHQNSGITDILMKPVDFDKIKRLVISAVCEAQAVEKSPSYR